MTNFRNNPVFHPAWIFISITLPQLILTGLLAGSYRVIESLLNDQAKMLWTCFLIIPIVMMTLFTVYGFLLHRKNRQVPTRLALAVIPGYIACLYLFGLNALKLFPTTIPSWMLSGNVYMYPGTFTMPALIHALVIVVGHLTPAGTGKRSWTNFLCATLIPLFWYVFFRIILPMYRFSGEQPWLHILLVLLIGSTVAFLFFIMRGVYVLMQGKSEKIRKYRKIWKPVLTLLFPLAGLSIYAGYLPQWQNPPRIFGDFSHPLFFILAALNGTALIMPDSGKTRSRICLYAAKLALFPFTLYFLIVFLPFFPLAVLAILAAGAGFLMLTPLLLTGIHITNLAGDFRQIKSTMKHHRLILLSIAAFLFIPGCITLDFYMDRIVLHRAMDSAWQPDYNMNTASGVSPALLHRVLKRLENHRSKNRSWEKRVPFITEYYTWLVLDNQTLSRKKTARLKHLFFDKATEKEEVSSPADRSDVELSDITTQTRFDDRRGVFSSRVNLELTNPGAPNAEFMTSFKLPEGTWVGGYSLWIGDREEKGEIVEKKTALWVYRQIRKTRRDPGIVYYEKGGRIVLRVFPFSRNEIRKTSLEFIHREPVTLSLGGKQILLGNNTSAWEHSKPVTSPDGRVLYVPSALKTSLPEVQREPYFHFILDLSRDAGNARESYAHQVHNTVSRFGLNRNRTKITLMNFSGKTCSWNDAWEDAIKKFPLRGGFSLDYAIKSVLIEHFQKNTMDYPVIIVITPDYDNAIFNHDLNDYAFAFPESSLFYELMPAGNLKTRPLTTHSPPHEEGKEIMTIENHPVRAWPNAEKPEAYLTGNFNPSVVLLPEKKNAPHQVSRITDKWTTGLVQQGLWMEQLLHPDRSGTSWQRLVQFSMQHQLLNPYTSFTVLENQAQWKALKRKQKLTLSGKKEFDLDEDAHEMDEPPLLFILLLPLILWIKMYHKRRCSQ